MKTKRRPRRKPLWPRLLKGLAILVLLLAGAGVVVTQTNLLVTQWAEREPADVAQAEALRQTPWPDSLKVMTWNVKFGAARVDFNFDCYGDRTALTHDEVMANLDGLARKINRVDPDILFLQEVDRGSDRVAGVDQLQELLDRTALNHAVYASQWHAYVPAQGVGRVNSGNAILSRWPLEQAERLRLPLRGDQPPHVRFFYLRRNILVATLRQGPPLHLVNTHLTAYATDNTRWRQLQELKGVMDNLAQGDGHLIAAGDLNTLPPGTKKVKDFDDDACAKKGVAEFDASDYSREATWLAPFYNDYQEAIRLQDYQANEARYYSHTVDGRGWWNRRLDYLFTNGYFANGLVHQDSAQGGMATMPLSDHAPITATWHPSPPTPADTLPHSTLPTQPAGPQPKPTP